MSQQQPTRRREFLAGAAVTGTGILVASFSDAAIAQATGDRGKVAGGKEEEVSPAEDLMREHGVRRICTRDVDFHRFAFLEVVDPL